MTPSYTLPPLGPGWSRPDRETAGAFLRRDSDRYLLVRRPRTKPTYPGFWDTPGGHVEPGEHPDATLARELHEELGITLVRYHLLTALEDIEPRTHLRYRHHIYLVTAWQGEIDQVLESDEESWLELPKILLLEQLNPVTRAATRVLQLFAAEVD